jgi:two-component sensor histidine kinase
MTTDAGFEHFLTGGGNAAACIRSLDWTATALGPVAQWPTSLRTAVGMVVTSRFPQCIFWGSELISIYNDAYRPILGGKPEAMGQPMRTVWAEVFEDIHPIALGALAGESTFIEDYALVINRHGYDEQTYFTFCYSPIRDGDGGGAIVGVLDTVVETTAKVVAEKTLRILNGELAHRIGNMLAMIGAIERQTYRSCASKDEMHVKLDERIRALGRAHEALTDDHCSGAPINAVIEAALAPLLDAKDRIRIEGPAMRLSTPQSLSMGMAVHELATNAIKYGAMSNDTGCIEIRWAAGAHGRDEFRWQWQEVNGPPVVVPTATGFGSKLLKDVLAADFGGRVDILYESGGLRCVLTTKASKVGAEPACVLRG